MAYDEFNATKLYGLLDSPSEGTLRVNNAEEGAAPASPLDLLKASLIDAQVVQRRAQYSLQDAQMRELAYNRDHATTGQSNISSPFLEATPIGGTQDTAIGVQDGTEQRLTAMLRSMVQTPQMQDTNSLVKYDPSKADVRAVRANMLLNEDGGANSLTQGNKIKASVDKNGRISYTNIGTDPSDGMIKAAVGATAEQAFTSGTLRDAIKQIKSSTDSDTQLGLYTSLQKSYATYSVDMHNKLMAIEETALDIPRIKEQIAKSESEDKILRMSNPLMTSSPATAGLLKELQLRSNLADSNVKTKLATNTEIAGLDAEMTTIPQFMNNAINKSGKLEAKADAQAMINAQVAANTPSFSYDNAKMLGLTNGSMTPVEQAISINKQTLYDKTTDGKLQNEAINTPPTEMVGKALITKNPYATRLAVSQEMNLSGRPQAAVEADIGTMNRLMTDGTFFSSELKRIPMAPADREQLTKAFTMANGATSNQAKMELAGERLKVVQQIMANRVTSQFTGDVSSWDNFSAVPRAGQSPTDTSVLMGVAIEKAKQSGLPLTIGNVGKQFIGDAVGAPRAALYKTFLNIANDYGSRRSNSSVAAIDMKLVNDSAAGMFVNTSPLRSISSKALDGAAMVTNNLLSAVPGYIPASYHGISNLFNNSTIDPNSNTPLK